MRLNNPQNIDLADELEHILHSLDEPIDTLVAFDLGQDNLMSAE